MSPGAQLARMLQDVDLAVVIPVVALVLARVLPLLLLSPVFGGEVVPAQAKMGFGLVVAALVYPAASAGARDLPSRSVLFVLLLGKEVLVGVCLAFLASVVFEAARVAGAAVDQVIGNVSSQLEVPEEHQNAPLLGNLQLQLSIALFVTLDGQRHVLNALGTSFERLPLATFPSFSAHGSAVLPLLLRGFSDSFRIGLGLAAPALLAAVVGDVALGIVNRVAPQIQLFFVSLALKPLVALTFVFLATTLVLERLGGEFARWLGQLGRAVTAFS